MLSSLSRLAIPIMATSLIQMAYNMTDMIWLGQIGSDSVAAVGTAGMYMWLSNGLAILARMGGQVHVAQRLGAGETQQAAKFARNALQMGIFFSIIYALIMVLFTSPLIGFFKLNNPAVVKDAEIYLLIVGGGIVFSILNQIFTGIITATGNSKTPFYATAVGLVFNIVFDPLLIFGIGPFPEMGVAGAAIATVAAQAVVMLLFVIYAKQDLHLFTHVNLKEKPNGDCIRKMVKIGLPSALQNMLFTGISMIIARLIAGFGDAAVAVQKVGSQIESISWMTADGFAAAVSSFVGQNYGAGSYKRAKKGFITSLSIMCVWGIFTSIVLIFAAAPIFKLFIPDPAIVPLGVDYLAILGFSQLFMCVDIVTAGAFAGFGHTLTPSISSTLLVAARIPTAMFLSSTVLGLNGIWWSISITSILRGIFAIILYMLFIKKLNKEHA